MMAIRLLIIIFVISMCAYLEADESYSQRTEKIVKLIRSLKSVEGSAVGEGAATGNFYVLALKLLKIGSQAEFLKMTSDKHTTVRIMGLYCLAKSQKDRSISTLKKRIDSNERFVCFPGGCMGGHTTEGKFVRNLIHNFYFLERYGSVEILSDSFELNYELPSNVRWRHLENENESLLDQEKLVGLDLEILSLDKCYALHNEASSFISKCIRQKYIHLNKTDLMQLCPSLQFYQIVKAIGRSRQRVATRNFLIQCLEDTTLTTKSRLAAASALTRYSDKKSILALKRNRRFLDSLSDEKFGSRFEKLALKRIEYRDFTEYLYLLRRYNFADTRQKQKDAAIAMYSNVHPMVLDELESSYMYSSTNDRKVLRSIEKTLLYMSENLKDYAQEWNTYSALWYRLDCIVHTGSLSSKINKAVKAKIIGNIENYSRKVSNKSGNK